MTDNLTTIDISALCDFERGDYITLFHATSREQLFRITAAGRTTLTVRPAHAFAIVEWVHAKLEDAAHAWRAVWS